MGRSRCCEEGREAETAHHGIQEGKRAMSKREVPVVLVTGYLGSGKTTLMQHILRQEKRRVALIVNDMGSINIDASLLSKSGNRLVQVEMVEMQNGCICCTLREEFMAEIERLSQDQSIEAIFVEASGISEPSSIAGAFVGYEEEMEESRVYLKTVVSVVDADRIYREFLHDLASEEENEEGDVINLVMDQIEFCNLLLLNKTDLLTEEQLQEVRDALRNIQRGAEIIPCIQGELELDRILDREDFDFEEVMASSTVQRALNASDSEETACMDEYGITSFVYEERAPFNRERFNRFVSEYPETLIRSKGYIWFADDDRHIQLFEQAGRNASVTELSEWVSAWSEEELAAMEQDFPDIREDWDEVYGDRVNQIVLIGKGYRRDEIVRQLDACLN